MIRLSLLCLAACLLFSQISSSSSVPSRERNTKPFKVVCYHGTWSVYRPEKGKFSVEDIDPLLCTHLIYTFVGLGADGKVKTLDGYLDLEENWGKGNFKRFNHLKSMNPELTTILAVGGWNEGSAKYSEMARDQNKRKNFIDSALAMVLKHDFDGFDLDWEYPANRGGVPEDKQNFITLLREMKSAFEPHGLLLTAAVSAGQSTIDSAYDIPSMNKYLDFINLMAYDFHGGWEKVTGHNSPLFARPDEQGAERNLNMDWSVNYWMSKGADPKKLVLGMATYGRAFTLQDPNKNGLGAPAPSAGRAGPYTREAGMLGFNEICDAQKRENWNVVMDNHHLSPYAYKGNQWVGYDDVYSITIKTDYVRARGLAGAMIWSIETDDFRGECFGQKYPLLTKINQNLNGDNPNPGTLPTTPPTRPTVEGETPKPQTPPSTTTTRKPFTSAPGELSCTTAGLFVHPKDCNRYYQCMESADTFSIIEYQCGSGTVFDDVNKVCGWPTKENGC